MLASTHPAIRLLGISTVACNQTLDKVTQNALATLDAIRDKTPVFQGQAKPIMRSTLLCEEIHGGTGARPHQAQVPLRQQAMRMCQDARCQHCLICAAALEAVRQRRQRQDAWSMRHMSKDVFSGSKASLVRPASDFGVCNSKYMPVMLPGVQG